jgi:hypothetical protein
MMRPETMSIAPLNTENMTSKTEVTRSLMEVMIDDMIVIGGCLSCVGKMAVKIVQIA